MSFYGGLYGVPAKDLEFVQEAVGGPSNLTRIYAYRAGVHVGAVGVSLYDKKYPYAAAIQYVYVPEAYRKTGVALALLREARKWIRLQKPETRYLLAKALWTGSDKMLHDAYGPHLISANEQSLRTTPPTGGWDGVRDGPGIEYVWWIKLVEKSPGKGIESVFGAGILDNPNFGAVLHADFMKATEYRRGKTHQTIRHQG